LYIASSKGFASIVEMLLDSNAESSLLGGPFGSALIAGCHGGKIESVWLLLSHNATIDSGPTTHFSALHKEIHSASKVSLTFCLTIEPM
jgi:hypothetical protein